MDTTVPWVNWTELYETGKALYKQSEPDVVYGALRRLHVWKTRCAQTTPVILDLCDSLFRAWLVDHRTFANKKSVDWLEAENVRGLLAIAIVRFVNHVNEACVAPGRLNVPIHLSLLEMGIPQWITELRHEIAHGTMPSIETLRQALKTSQEWLWKFYWKDRIKPLSLAEQRQEVPLDIDSSCGPKSRRSKKRTSSLPLMNENLAKLKKVDDSEVLQHCHTALVGYFNAVRDPSFQNIACSIPKRRLENVLKEHSNQLMKLIVQDSYLVDAEALDKESIDDCLLNRAKTWKPLLQLLVDNGCIWRFLRSLLLQIHHEITSAARRHVLEQLRYWATDIVSSFGKDEPSHSALEVDWKQILRMMLTYPNVFPEGTVEEVMRLCELNDTQRRQIFNLIKMVDGGADNVNMNESAGLQNSGSIWSMAHGSNEDWSEIPFGATFLPPRSADDEEVTVIESDVQERAVHDILAAIPDCAIDEPDCEISVVDTEKCSAAAQTSFSDGQRAIISNEYFEVI